MNILITGASSGIGLEIFNELKKDKDNNFFLISRKKQNKIHKDNVKHYQIDLSNLKLLKKKLKIIANDSEKKIDLILKKDSLIITNSDFDITSSEVNVAALSWKSFLCLGPLFLLCLPLFGIFTYFG